MKRGYRCSHICFVLLSLLPGYLAGQQYNIIKQGVCWTDTTGVDSSLTRLVYVSISGAGPISVNYVNAQGASVDVSAGGSFEMGYCGCCADTAAIDFLYYQFGDTIRNGDTLISPFDSGEIFYVSTNGNNATGRKGYMELPFLPGAPMDSLEKSTQWYYPGNYSYNFSGKTPGNIYAPTTNILSTSNLPLSFPQNDTAVFLTYQSIETQNTRFVSESQRKFFLYSKYIKHNHSTPNNFFALLAKGEIYSDSIDCNNLFSYIEPRSGQNPLIKTSCFFSNNAVYPNFVLAGFDKTGSLTKIEIDRFLSENSACNFLIASGRKNQNAKQAIEIKDATITDTLSVTDTLYNSTYLSQDGNPSNRNVMCFLSLNGANDTYGDSIYFRFETKKLNSSKGIEIFQLTDANKIDLLLGDATFTKTRAVYIRNIAAANNSRINIYGSVVCENSVPIVSTATNTSGIEINISGKYKTERSGNPVIYTLGDIVLENASLINDGTSPAIESPSPITVFVRGDLYMNSDSIHPNVTFEKIEYGYENCNGSFEDTQTFLSGFCPPAYNGTAFATTDGSGDITVTIGETMPDATYTVLLAAQGSTFQHVQVQSQTATTFVARFFDAAGAPITGTGVVLDWEVRDR